MLRLPRGDVLDIGSADGWAQGYLPRGCRYVSLDYPVTGHELYGARPSVFADAKELPFADESFDSVLMFEVVEHLRSPLTALKEAARVLRPGGALFLTMPFLYPVHDAPHDYQRLTCHGLLRDVESTGLQVRDFRRSLGAIETAGLNACLAIGGVAVQTWRTRHPALLLLPLLLGAIPCVNLLAWVTSRFVPDWDAATVGYVLSAVRT